MISPTLTSFSAGSNNGVTSPLPASSALSSDFETFIKMLTTQAKYQDPLEPLDSSEYAAQLAQFSMVEQQVLSNDLLSALAAQLGSSTMGQMAGWIGMEARTTAAVLFDTDPITVLPTPPAGAESMELVVYDNDGREVTRHPMPVSSDPVVWAGVQQGGQPLPSGMYRFEVEATGEGGAALPATLVETYARIVEVQNLGSGARVVFEGGAEAPASEISALREPS
ncbi:flagellar hook capping FlgD N-terminal domain-containing protein [Sulfitobacter guttiformis]|uniref:Basal-body rod modification protein FlgD n=1 Tax=Sulfitobacter guttiformis TaxID=74349 RepID=A0A420DSL3_9RHOB|nr:flagellar hook capping FlgD N-terminal domain-containing protein [Sulfitobacter guttiformis]KIN74540.1 Flagellar basal-body rod modification protein FlgD [Sulfitobacter guttiformis KCTC 32187]RKE97127.1 flagellar basal-body rod modification protein FlgD [Sulfitobacter guttiformis]